MSDKTAEQLQNLLNDAAQMCQNATEESLPFVHGFYVGVLQGITAMGYTCDWNMEYWRYAVHTDPCKNDKHRTYACYLARIIQNHFLLYIRGQDIEHEKAIMDGMEEVLAVCGYKLITDFNTGLFSATANNMPAS